MSYKIIFKGQIGDEFVDDSRGRRLADDWEAGKLTGRVRINDNLYEASAIKAVMSGFNTPDNSDKNEQFRRETEEMWNSFNKARDYKMSLSLEERAKDTELARCLFAAYGVPFPEKEVIAAQLKSLKEFPNFAVAKPTYYKHLLGVFPAGKAEYKSMKELIPLAALNLAERVIQNNVT